MKHWDSSSTLAVTRNSSRKFSSWDNQFIFPFLIHSCIFFSSKWNWLQKSILLLQIPLCSINRACPSKGVLNFSAFAVLSYIRHYHLHQVFIFVLKDYSLVFFFSSNMLPIFQLFSPPQHLTVKGRSHSYVKKVSSSILIPPTMNFVKIGINIYF